MHRNSVCRSVVQLFEMAWRQTVRRQRLSDYYLTKSC